MPPWGWWPLSASSLHNGARRFEWVLWAVAQSYVSTEGTVIDSYIPLFIGTLNGES